MSLGYAPTEPPPFDPDDPNAIGAPSALAPPPVTAPAPAGLSGVDVGAVANDIGNVGQQPAPAPSAGTGLAGLDVDKAAANLGAVGQTPAPAPAPAAAAPVVPPATGAPTPPPAALSDLQKAQADEKTAREASDKANGEFAKAQQASIEANQRVADQRVKDEQEAKRQRAETVQRYQTAEAAAQKQIEQTQAAVKGFKFRDYFSDGKDGTDWARKIGVALATALGAFGAGLTHGPNYALQILNKDMDDSHQAQLDDLGKMKDQEVMARTGLADVQSARAKALADLTVGDAARDRLVAAQLEQAAARNKTAEFAPGLVAAAQKLKLDAAEKDTAAKKQLVELNMKLADESRKGRLDEASISEKNAAAHLHTVQADAGGFAPHHGKGGGAGAGGGGSVASVGANAEELARRIREGHDGKPLTDDQVIHAATELHIPLAGKAGVVTLDKVRSVAKFDADAAAKAARTGVQADRLDEGRFKDFEKEHGLPKLEFTQHKLAEVLKKLDSGNPTGAMSSLMEFDAAAKGGNATEASMHAIQGRLGGLWDQIKGAVAKGESGKFADSQITNLRGAVQDALGANKETIDKVHDAFGRQFDYSKPGVKQRAAGMFGALGYQGAGAAPGASIPEGLPPGTVAAGKTKDGRAAFRLPSGKLVAQ